MTKRTLQQPPRPPAPKTRLQSGPTLESTLPPPPPPRTPSKPSLFARYNALPLRAKLYIWISTAAVAWLADSVSDRVFEQSMVDAEAERRVQHELQKLREKGE